MKKYTILLLLMINLVSQAFSQEKKFDSFGEKIKDGQALSVSDLLASLMGKDSLKARVSGEISEVCQMKGCWMNVFDTQNEEASVFVRFKDYAFFVPKDASGKEAILEGMAYREVTSVEELRHYAEDAGKSAEEIAKITEPKEEIRFMAQGVLISK